MFSASGGIAIAWSSFILLACYGVSATVPDVHSATIHAGEKKFGEQFDATIEYASQRKWKEAARELADSDWCSAHDKACKADISQLEEGCPGEEAQ